MARESNVGQRWILTKTPQANPLRVAIVDYGMGNLFSVMNACERVGFRAAVTSLPAQLLAADLVILPGVGAFGDAMESLNKSDLVGPLRDVAASNKPLVGICLGMQLLMTESHEFGSHQGLGIIEGPVVHFGKPIDTQGHFKGRSSKYLKVPQVGWNSILRGENGTSEPGGSPINPWSGSPLTGLPDGEYVYFVHSFYAKPEHPGVVLSMSRYGDIEFCSSLRFGSIFACQFHPERSGVQGLNIYRNLTELLTA